MLFASQILLAKPYLKSGQFLQISDLANLSEQSKIEVGDSRDGTPVPVLRSDVGPSGAAGEAGGIEVVTWKWDDVTSEVQRSL